MAVECLIHSGMPAATVAVLGLPQAFATAWVHQTARQHDQAAQTLAIVAAFDKSAVKRASKVLSNA